MRAVRSWGATGNDLHQVIRLDLPQAVPHVVMNIHPGIAHGNGRSYGDVALNPGGVLWSTLGLDRFVGWDPETGILRCEAGVLLQDIQKVFIPQGWMLPVTPGTLLATVGGAIANDVHGKNHHFEGSFGDHIVRLWLARTDGSLVECSRTSNQALLSATIGGLGLTGVITLVELKLRRVAGPWLDTETIPFNGLVQFFDLANRSHTNWEHTVSWIDCLSGGGSDVRGLFMRANHSPESGGDVKISERQWRMPFTPPISLFNMLTLPLLNCAYFFSHSRKGRIAKRHYQGYLYPLDAISFWNRIYGPRGFYQYQVVLPMSFAFDALSAMLKEIRLRKQGSFLSVLKTFGDRTPSGMLSFPRYGATLALDFPNNQPGTLELFERLDAIALEAGGALYPAKDARMSRSMFEAGYPGLSDFTNYRDPGISSSMSRRLMGS